MNVGPTELLFVLLIALLIFGGTKLPKLARSLGQAKNEFQKGLDDPTTAADEKGQTPEKGKASAPAESGDPAEAARIAALEQELQDLKRTKDDKGPTG